MRRKPSIVGEAAGADNLPWWRRPEKWMKRRDARKYRGSSKARSVMCTFGHHSISLFRINMKKQEEKIIE